MFNQKTQDYQSLLNLKFVLEPPYKSMLRINDL